MAWTESVRTPTGIIFANGRQRRYEQVLKARLHYGSPLRRVNCHPRHVNTPTFEGYYIDQADAKISVGARPGLGDGWVGFAAHGAKFWSRLDQIVWFNWAAKTWVTIGSAASYDRANLKQGTQTLVVGPKGAEVEIPVASSWEWQGVLPLTTIAQVSEDWRGKETVTVAEKARPDIANAYPGGDAKNQWLTLVYKIDAQDVPAWVINGAVVSDDFNDSAGSIGVRSAVSDLAFFMPIDNVTVGDPLSGGAQARLTKRIYQHNGQWYLLAGVRADVYNSLPTGDLIFDPTLTLQPDAAAGIDTFLSSANPDTAQDINSKFIEHQTGPVLNALISFDLSSIPAGASIDSATLSLWTYVNPASNSVGKFNRILVANNGWVEAATRNYADGAGASQRWAGDTGNDGGADAGCSQSGTDYGATALGTIAWAAAQGIDEEVQSVFDTTEFALMIAANYGMCLSYSSGVNAYLQYHSSDAVGGDAAYRPRLVVVYTVAATGGGMMLLGVG